MLFNAQSANSGLGYYSQSMVSTEVLRAEEEDGQTVTGTLDINRDGSINWDGDVSTGDDETHNYWSKQVGTPGDLMHVRISFSSGTNVYSSGAGLASWLALSSNRQWVFTKASGGGPELSEGDFTVEFSFDGGSTVEDTITINVELFERSP